MNAGRIIYAARYRYMIKTSMHTSNDILYTNHAVSDAYSDLCGIPPLYVLPFCIPKSVNETVSCITQCISNHELTSKAISLNIYTLNGKLMMNKKNWRSTCYISKQRIQVNKVQDTSSCGVIVRLQLIIFMQRTSAAIITITNTRKQMHTNSKMRI